MSKKQQVPRFPEPAEQVWIINYMYQAMPWYGVFQTKDDAQRFADSWESEWKPEIVSVPLNPIGEDVDEIALRASQVRKRFGPQGQR